MRMTNILLAIIAILLASISYRLYYHKERVVTYGEIQDIIKSSGTNQAKQRRLDELVRGAPVFYLHDGYVQVSGEVKIDSP